MLSPASRGLSSRVSQPIFVGRRNRPWRIALKRIQPPRRAIFRSIHARNEQGSLDCHSLTLCRADDAQAHVRHMKKSDIICPNCNAGYRRVELASGARTTGEFRCLLCDHVLEVFDGTAEVAIRLTVQPEKTFQGINN